MPYSEYEFFGFKTAPKNLDDPIDEITDSDYLDETVVTNPQTQGEFPCPTSSSTTSIQP